MPMPSDSADRSLDGSRRRTQEEATYLLLEGRHAEAVRILRAQSLADLADRNILAQLACALAYDGALDEADTVIGKVRRNDEDPIVRAWLAAAEGLLASRRGDVQSARTHLLEARGNDPNNPLVVLMLGRLEMLVDKKMEQAEERFRWLLARFPKSETAALHLVPALYEAEKRSEGREVAIRNARVHPRSLKSVLMAFYAIVVASPMHGGLFVTTLAILTFFPYLGSLILITWLVVALSSNIALRRIWPRIAIFPIVSLIAIVLGYVARSIVWGQLYP